MTQLLRRRPGWAGPAIIAAVCLAGVGGGCIASSAAPAAYFRPPPGHGAPVHVQVNTRTNAANAADAAHKPKVLLPNKKSLVKGVVGLATSNRATRAKLDLRIPAVTAVAYLDPAYRTPTSQTAPVPSYYLPKHPVPGCKYEEGILYTDLYAVKIHQPNKNKQGVVKSVGRFPSIQVSALGFGAIPVTATLHTHQIRRNGKILPLIANTVTSYLTADKSGASCDPDWEGGKQTPPLNTVSGGKLAVRISDVSVDQQPLDVGNHCGTTVSLNLFGRAGYIAYTGGQLVERYDPRMVHAGPSTYPLHPGSTNLFIPNFSGCVNPRTGEDYSRLISAMVAGPNNTVVAHQSGAILNGINNHHVTVCDKDMGCVKLPKFVNPPRPGMLGHRAHH